MKLLTLLATILTIGTVSCTYHYREVESGVSSKDAEQDLSELAQRSSALNVLVQALETNRSEVDLFAARSHSNPDLSPMGPIHAVAPFENYFVQNHLTGISNINEIEEIKAYFIAVNETRGYLGGLVLMYRKSGETNFNSKIYTNIGDDTGLPTGYFEDGTFIMELMSDDGSSINITSDDVTEDELKAAIQLKIFMNIEGETVEVGQISSMESL
jgi:hypothetical protein